jgi:NAD(P)-dependent dehydrogenase (short-subunit alcohol dehydrogenase family)
MKQKNVIITGGHSGIGLELTKLILRDGHKAGLILRNESTLNDAKQKLEQFGYNNVDFFVADLSRQEDVLKVARLITNTWQSVDVLFNNAGVLLGEQTFSPQQNEMHYEVNTLAPYLLTTNLYQALHNAEGAVVVNTVTDGLNMMKGIKTEALIGPSKFKKLFGAYLQSKLALALLMSDLAVNWKSEKIRILNVTPGGNKTKLTAGSGMPSLLKPIVKLLYKDPAVGAKLLYGAAFEDEFSGKTGVFIQKNKIEDLKLSISNELKLILLKGIKTTASKRHFSI